MTYLNQFIFFFVATTRAYLEIGSLSDISLSFDLTGGLDSEEMCFSVRKPKEPFKIDIDKLALKNQWKISNLFNTSAIYIT